MNRSKGEAVTQEELRLKEFSKKMLAIFKRTSERFNYLGAFEVFSRALDVSESNSFSVSLSKTNLRSGGALLDEFIEKFASSDNLPLSYYDLAVEFTEAATLFTEASDNVKNQELQRQFVVAANKLAFAAERMTSMCEHINQAAEEQEPRDAVLPDAHPILTLILQGMEGGLDRVDLNEIKLRKEES